MKSYNIAVIGGDGTGPEVVREAVKVLDAAAKKFNLKLTYTNYDLGGERYLRTGEALPDSVLAELRKFPAIRSEGPRCRCKEIQSQTHLYQLRSWRRALFAHR